jgi:hypothetical protein
MLPITIFDQGIRFNCDTCNPLPIALLPAHAERLLYQLRIVLVSGQELIFERHPNFNNTFIKKGANPDNAVTWSEEGLREWAKKQFRGSRVVAVEIDDDGGIMKGGFRPGKGLFKNPVTPDETFEWHEPKFNGNEWYEEELKKHMERMMKEMATTGMFIFYGTPKHRVTYSEPKKAKKKAMLDLVSKYPQKVPKPEYKWNLKGGGKQKI